MQLINNSLALKQLNGSQAFFLGEHDIFFD